MSDLERAVLLEFDHIPTVVDIREQFPLPREKTMRLAVQAGISHPSHHGVNVVMSTDLVIDIARETGREEIAVSIKYASELDSRRTLEKLEIERRYWHSLNRRWFLLTELDINADATKLALWRHGWESFDHLDCPTMTYWPDRCDAMLRALAAEEERKLLEIIADLETEQGFAPGDGFTVIRHLLATGALSIAPGIAFSPRGSSNQLIVHKPAQFQIKQKDVA